MKYLALCFLLVGCGPNCEERGGVLVQDGYFYVWQTMGKGGWLQQHPYYVCKEKGAP